MRTRPVDWVPPGPLPAGSQGDPLLTPAPGETLDCICGHWKIFQLRRGHRYSTDDLLAAWYAVRAYREVGRAPLSHLDLGCGIGSVSLLVLWHFPSLKAVGIEAQAGSCDLARRSARFNGVADRFEIRTADFRAPGPLGEGEVFDLVTASPPYLRLIEGRRSELPQRGPCRFEDRGGTADYLRVMARRLAPGGSAIWVHATRYLDQNLQAAADAGFESVRWCRVAFREGADSLITLFQGRAGCFGRMDRLEAPSLAVRARDGQWGDTYRRIREFMGFPGRRSPLAGTP